MEPNPNPPLVMQTETNNEPCQQPEPQEPQPQMPSIPFEPIVEANPIMNNSSPLPPAPQELSAPVEQLNTGLQLPANTNAIDLVDEPGEIAEPAESQPPVQDTVQEKREQRLAVYQNEAQVTARMDQEGVINLVSVEDEANDAPQEPNPASETPPPPIQNTQLQEPSSIENRSSLQGEGNQTPVFKTQTPLQAVQPLEIEQPLPQNLQTVFINMQEQSREPSKNNDQIQVVSVEDISVINEVHEPEAQVQEKSHVLDHVEEKRVEIQEPVVQPPVENTQKAVESLPQIAHQIEDNSQKPQEQQQEESLNQQSIIQPNQISIPVSVEPQPQQIIQEEEAQPQPLPEQPSASQPDLNQLVNFSTESPQLTDIHEIRNLLLKFLPTHLKELTLTLADEQLREMYLEIRAEEEKKAIATNLGNNPKPKEVIDVEGQQRPKQTTSQPQPVSQQQSDPTKTTKPSSQPLSSSIPNQPTKSHKRSRKQKKRVVTTVVQQVEYYDDSDGEHPSKRMLLENGELKKKKTSVKGNLQSVLGQLCTLIRSLDLSELNARTSNNS